MRNHAITYASFCLLLIAALAPRLSATVLVPADLAGLVQSAQLIVYGRVSNAVAIRSADHGTETIVTLAVGGYLKGTGSGEVAFRVPGGEIGRYRTIVVGAPAFHEGDEVVCFLKGQAPQIPILVGFNQGVLRVFPDGNGVRRLLAPPLRQAQPEPVVRGDGYKRLVTLEEFAARVREADGLKPDRQEERDSRPAPRKLNREGR